MMVLMGIAVKALWAFFNNLIREIMDNFRNPTELASHSVKIGQTYNV